MNQTKITTDSVVGMYNQVRSLQVGQGGFKDPLPRAHLAMCARSKNFIVTDNDQFLIDQSETTVQKTCRDGNAFCKDAPRQKIGLPANWQVARRQKIE